MSKILVAYYSRADENYAVGTVEVGNTELLAREIVKQTGADEFKIDTIKPYAVDYATSIEEAKRELTENARPDYKGEIDLSAYDTIFLGFPIWWGDLPMVVYKFIEDHDFAGKTVIPFNTHEGSGNSGTYSHLKSMLAGATLQGDGFNLTGREARTADGLNAVDAWLEKLGF